MKYDIAIVGGGMVGAALAVSLQNSELRIVLIDAATSHANDHRLIALNYASVLFFKKLNLWADLAPHAEAINEVHVSNRGYFGTTRLTAKEMHIDHLGYVVPAKKINLALYEKLAELSHVKILYGTKVTELSQDPNEVEFTIQNQAEEKSLQASFLVAADGTFSTVRELLHIPTEMIDYQQKALVTITELLRGHHHIAYERFLTNGAIAMLPLTRQRAATIWSGDEKYIDELLKLSDEDFLKKLQEHFGYRLGKFIKTQQRFSYPLKFIKAKQQVKNRVILIGNAAHTVHPIAAQGLNVALSEVNLLANHFNEKTQALFTELPKIPMQKSVNLSHRLTQLFSADFFVINAARQLGMIGLDICLPVKKRFGKQTLGLL
ncbi:MAG TPA: FAD-dependent monooxygenase [Gammaproteobacteria bacterium]|nr:FAD-dependent monooxygenase [Gammaproteobacteria bacterium]